MKRKLDKRTQPLAALVLGAAALGLSAPVSFAHHSYSQFDTGKCLTVAGTVRNVQMTYPHVWIWIKAPGANGAVDVWGFEGASPVVLQRVGWPKEALKVGDQVTVRYSPLKDGRKGGAFGSIVKADGTELRSGSPACTTKR